MEKENIAKNVIHLYELAKFRLGQLIHIPMINIFSLHLMRG